MTNPRALFTLTLEFDGKKFIAEILDMDISFEWRIGALRGTAHITRDTIEVRVTGGRLHALGSLVSGRSSMNEMLEVSRILSCVTGRRVVRLSRLLPPKIFEPDSC